MRSDDHVDATPTVICCFPNTIHQIRTTGQQTVWNFALGMHTQNPSHTMNRENMMMNDTKHTASPQFRRPTFPPTKTATQLHHITHSFVNEIQWYRVGCFFYSVCAHERWSSCERVDRAQS